MRGATMGAWLSAILLLASGSSACEQDRDLPRTDAPALVTDKIILVEPSRAVRHRGHATPRP